MGETSVSGKENRKLVSHVVRDDIHGFVEKLDSRPGGLKQLRQGR